MVSHWFTDQALQIPLIHIPTALQIKWFETCGTLLDYFYVLIFHDISYGNAAAQQGKDGIKKGGE